MERLELIKRLRQDIAFFNENKQPLLGGLFTLYRTQEILPTLVGEVSEDDHIFCLALEAREVRHWSAQAREYVILLSRIVTLLEAA